MSVLVVATFWNSLDGVFLLDDFASIHQNPSIRSLRTAISPPNQGQSVAGRPVANLTLALNYSISGLEARGYHVVNIALHMGCALLAFGILRRLLRLKGTRQMAEYANQVALTIVAVWAIHPLQTEVVDYIVARTESLMALCYLLCVYAAIRAHENADSARGWSALAIIAAGLGMLSKESMVTIPVAVILIDRAFFFSSLREAFRVRRSLYLGLCATWLILATVVASAPRANSAGFAIRADAASDVSLTTYLKNQAHIVPHYMRLLVWPSNLVLDYGFVKEASDALLPTIFIAAICLAGVILWFARPIFGLPIVLCIILLAPTSLVPIVSEVGAERRMYLASLVMIASFVACLWMLVSRRVLIAAIACVVIALGMATTERNAEYRSTYGMWKTVVERWPHGRAYLNLAVAADEEGRASEVLPALRNAVTDFPDAEYPLGERLYQQRSYAESIQHLQVFLEKRSTHVQAEAAKQLLAKSWTDLAIEQGNQGQLANANASFVQALRLEPTNPDLLRNVATSFFLMQRSTEAKRYALEVLKYRPSDPVAANLLRELSSQNQ